MENKQELVNRLLDSLIPKFEEHQFRLNRKGPFFRRNFAGGSQIFYLFIYKKKTYFTIRPEIRIKIKAIEDIYSSITSIEGRPYITLGNHLMEIVRIMDSGDETIRKVQGDWLVENEGHLDKLLEVIPEYLEETILPYFSTYSSISMVDEILNREPRKMSVHNWIYPLRANIALIAAKLNANPNIDKLIDIYNSELKDAAASYKDEFQKIVAFIKS